MPGLDSYELRQTYRILYDRGAISWGYAEDVYEQGKESVNETPFRSPQGKADWDLLKEWVTKATGDNRVKPGAEKLRDFHAAALRILRRLDARANRVVPEDENDDPMIEEISMIGGGKRKSQAAKFCRCIKSVRKTIRPRKGSTAESAAIGVCVKSVLHSRGRTVKRFKCGRPSRLTTQKRKSS